MKITVINGSPRGKFSTTLMHVKYMFHKTPGHELRWHHVAATIKNLEKDADAFTKVMQDVADADLVIWSYPIYYFCVPAQLLRFIELIDERGTGNAFQSKAATSMTTSAKFYDHIGHNFIQSVCEDMGMRYMPGYSAVFERFLEKPLRTDLLRFTGDLLHQISAHWPSPRRSGPLRDQHKAYWPASLADEPPSPTGSKKIVVVTDAREGQTCTLNAMIDMFVHSTVNQVRLLRLEQLNIKGGCIGCYTCVKKGDCVYKDHYRQTYMDQIASSHALIIAAGTRGRYLSAEMKTWLDRLFFNGHRPVLAGRCAGVLLAGPLNQLPELREALEAMLEVWRMPSMGVVTDEYATEAELTAQLQAFASRLDYRLEHEHFTRETFLGLGGQMIFRDLVYQMKTFMQADHKYYKKKGLYDYPTSNIGMAFNHFFQGWFMRMATPQQIRHHARVERLKRYEEKMDD